MRTIPHLVPYVEWDAQRDSDLQSPAPTLQRAEPIYGGVEAKSKAAAAKKMKYYPLTHGWLLQSPRD